MSPSIPQPISYAEVLARVPMRAAIEAVEAAYAALHHGAISPPASTGATAEAGTFHVKTCVATAAYAPIFVAKVNSNFPGNHACGGLPTIQGIVAVFETGSGRLRALVDSPAVTQLRTAATTAVAIARLARAGAARATLVGCGALGRFHLEALAECGFATVTLVDRAAARANELAHWGRASLGVECVPAGDIREAARAADVVVTCTTSRTPLLAGDDVRHGTLVAAVGADNPAKAEIAPSLLAQARIVADDVAQCRKGGDLRNAGPQDRVCGELVDAVAGTVARCGPEEIVVFDSTGQAVGDLAICRLLLGG
jgi:ornithine cyclodeaminase/alanine dehydrogenase-like protein (mu-crystallin family)